MNYKIKNSSRNIKVILFKLGINVCQVKYKILPLCCVNPWQLVLLYSCNPYLLWTKYLHQFNQAKRGGWFYSDHIQHFISLPAQQEWTMCGLHEKWESLFSVKWTPKLKYYCCHGNRMVNVNLCLTWHSLLVPSLNRILPIFSEIILDFVIYVCTESIVTSSVL